MKKLFLFLILTTGWLISGGQELHKPVQPLNESGYTLAQFEAFASNPTEYSASYREKLLEIVNHFLRETGLYKNYNNGNPLDDSWISWIFYPSRTFTEWRIYPNGFRNTRQSFDGKSVEWFWDKRRFEGLATALHLEGYELDLGKTVCTNLVDVPYKFVGIKMETPKPKPEPFVKTRQDELDYTSSIIIKKVKEEYVNPNLFVTETVRTKTWFGRHWGWFAGVFVGSGLIMGGIHLYKNHHHDDGGPGGAPKTPPVITPPPVIIPPVVDPGGPGGAPKTP